MVGKRVEIVVLPGTNPEPDATELETLHYTDTDNVYFNNGKLWTLPGYLAVLFAVDNYIGGAARSLISYRSTTANYIIGTSSRLYSYQLGTLYNITPIDSTTHAIANSISTVYSALANNPITTEIGSTDLEIAWVFPRPVLTGDSVKISGAATTRGVPNTEINAVHIVRDSAFNSFTISVATPATSSGTGGGASVVAATGILHIAAASNDLSPGDRVKIAAAATTGGILDTVINAEHIIRAVNTSTGFDIVVSSFATSAVSGGGGASTTYQKPIDAGAIDFSRGVGYGGGLYGVGLYGVAKEFANTFVYPQIWSGGAYGNDFICTPGGSSPLYIRSGNDTEEAPTVLSGAPTGIDWVGITGNFVVALNGNRVRVSDAGDATNWTPGAASYAYDDAIEGAADFISMITTAAINILYTENQMYLFSFVDKPNIWETTLLHSSDGLIAPKARIAVEESVYSMGQGDFYWFDGASVQSLPNNTCRRYIYKNLNYNAVWKSFCRHDPVRKQIMFAFPLFGANECSHRLIYNYEEKHCTLGTEDSSCAEENVLSIQNPYTVWSIYPENEGVIFQRDIGDNAGDIYTPLSAYAETNYVMIGEGDDTMEITEITPDSTQTGNIDMTIYTKDYAQSTEEFVYPLDPITPTTIFLDVQAAGRQRKYRISKNDFGENFSIGKWYETIVKRTPL